LGQLFTLCAHSHRRTARLAMQAAHLTHPTLLPEPLSRELSLRTALDHLRSMTIDWPNQSLGWATPCPVPMAQTTHDLNEAQAAAVLQRLQAWLETSVLGQPMSDWVAKHSAPEAFLAWCQQNASAVPPARFLLECHATASALKTTFRPLDLLDTDPDTQTLQLRQVAQAIRSQPDFAQQPNWQAQCAETGAWTRVHPSQTATAGSLDTSGGLSAWTRLASRWFELVQLCVDEAIQAIPHAGLSSGALALGQGQGLGWCEMARGLLLHWVQLDAQGRVDAYQVIAPTEWNFHPDGALAMALAQLSPKDTAEATLLGMAFDACVACQVSPAVFTGTSHA
jgi:Nickel-dependent hydrogenase